MLVPEMLVLSVHNDILPHKGHQVLYAVNVPSAARTQLWASAFTVVAAPEQRLSPVRYKRCAPPFSPLWEGTALLHYKLDVVAHTATLRGVPVIPTALVAATSRNGR